MVTVDWYGTHSRSQYDLLARCPSLTDDAYILLILRHSHNDDSLIIRRLHFCLSFFRSRSEGSLSGVTRPQSNYPFVPSDTYLIGLQNGSRTLITRRQ